MTDGQSLSVTVSRSPRYLFTVAIHTIGTLYLLPPIPPPMPAMVSSCQCPEHRLRSWGGSGSSPPMEQTCHRRVSGSGGGYLIPESVLCTACGGSRRESGGCYASKPAPFIPPLDNILTWPPGKEGYPIKYWVWGGRGGGCLPLRFPTRPILGLDVCCQRSRLQVCRTLW